MTAFGPASPESALRTQLHTGCLRRRWILVILVLLAPSWTQAADSPLFASIVALDRAAFDRAIAAGADVNETDDYGQTPLMYAVAQRQVGLSSALVAAGADVRAATQAGWTALHYAAEEGAPAALVTLLLEAGADPRTRNGSGETAEGIAARIGNEPFLDAARAFAESVRGRLMDAITNLDGATFVAALEYGTDVDQADAFGQTPLMYAVAANQLGMVRRLLDAGADANARSGAGWTALHYAARAGVAETIATALLEAGASRSAANHDGDTAQVLAQREGNAPFLAAHERFEAAAQARAEAERQAAADRAAAATAAGRGLPRSSSGASDTCAPLVTSAGTRAVLIEGTSQGQDEFWREALSSVFGSSVSREGGNTYVGIDTFRRAVFIAEVPYARACSDGLAVIDLSEVRACAVQFDAWSMSGFRPSRIDLQLSNQATTTVRVELPWSSTRGLDRLASCTVTTVGW